MGLFVGSSKEPDLRRVIIENLKKEISVLKEERCNLKEERDKLEQDSINGSFIELLTIALFSHLESYLYVEAPDRKKEQGTNRCRVVISIPNTHEEPYDFFISTEILKQILANYGFKLFESCGECTIERLKDDKQIKFMKEVIK